MTKRTASDNTGLCNRYTAYEAAPNVINGRLTEYLAAMGDVAVNTSKANAAAMRTLFGVAAVTWSVSSATPTTPVPTAATVASEILRDRWKTPTPKRKHRFNGDNR